MGLFKDIKNLKEASAEHGGMESLRDARRDISHAFDDRGEREILKTGITAMAVVHGIMMPVQGDRFAMQVPLEVHPPEGDPYTVHYAFTASRMQAPLAPGMEVPIKISAEDPMKIAVQWDAQKAAVAAGGGALAVSMEGLSRISQEGDMQAMASEALASVGAKMPENMVPKMPVADPKARLEQLDELKRSGLIDDAEYQTKRQQILDQL
jgi:hypothetical protein